jgi:dihydrofolate synthase / folylpolyglutamate synthase
VEIAVLEVGLGGRLDATTVGAPAATVLSRIDLDHQAWLGPTLSAIAVEKAAIIRTGVALSAAQHPEVLPVVLARAAAAGVPLRLEGRDLHVTVLERDLSGQLISCRGPGWSLDSARLALLGTYQPSNALLAVATARELGTTEAAIRIGLARARWPGRLQVVPGRPTLVLDAAHNPAGAAALASSLRDLFGDSGLTFVLGVLRDKDAAGILAALAPLAGRLILTGPKTPRAADPRALRALVPATVPRVEIADTVVEALAMARSPAATPIVCVAGSVVLIGEVLAYLRGEGDKPCCIENGAASIGPLSW